MKLNDRVDLKNFTYKRLKEYLASEREKPFRAEQLMKWLYQKKASSFSEMTNLSKEFRQKLEKKCEISTLKIVQRLLSADETEKFLLKLRDGKTIESVYMPSKDRQTLCISTQVGCRMGCKFCLTATQGLMRNLEPSEIINQVLEIQKAVSKRMTNIVMMGMGEPLDNYENVLDALDILQSQWGLSISQRKITVSTVGWVPEIIRFGQDSDVNLAISLNAPNDEIRRSIMPINRKYPLTALFEACRQFPLKPGRRITFEYVMLAEINDSLEHAKELTKNIRGLKCKVNLIPFNEYEKGSYRRPSEERVNQFQKYLRDHYITATIRHSRGQDILAACGQLESRQIKS